MPLTYDDSVDNVQNQPGTTLAVTASSTSSVYVTGSVLVSQSNWPAGAAVTISGQPIYINTTATLAVSQSNTPLGTQTVSQSNWPAGATVSQSNTPAGTQTVSMSNWPAGATVSQSNTPAGTQTVSGNFNVGINGTVAMSQSNLPAGTTVVIITSSVTPTVTTQNPSLTGVALKAANVSRRGLTIYNQTSQVLYVAMGTTASLTSFSIIMDVSGYYEAPYGYNGAFWGLNPAAGTGLVYVTEVV